MKKAVLAFLLILVFAILSFWGYLGIVASQNDTSCIPGEYTPFNNIEIAHQLQAVLNEYSDMHGNVSLQATVILPDGTEWNGASGYANAAKACPMTLEHNLYIGSITKTFTASLVMEQVEAGRIHLDDTLSKWIQHPDGDRITVEMLLRHTSGIPSYTDEIILQLFGLPKKQFLTGDLYATVAYKSLKFEPGSRHEYSNTNYLILGMILENVTGKSYGELLNNTSTQMGLARIYYPVYSNSLILANGYDETLLNLGKRNLTAFRTSMESGAFSAGGIAGSSHDVAFFFHTLLTKKWLNAETVEQMLDTIDAPDEDLPLQVGYGLGVRNFLIDGESLYGHSGTIPGYSGISLYNPKYGYTIAILSNVSTIDQMSIYGDLQKVILEYNQ
ncbi:MAG TPA: serine hydrolase domain-containing protein [Anaerolineales bacterium]|nr:serine hydrolase domain-containing protein [Anaerolineales bacterium]